MASPKTNIDIKRSNRVLVYKELLERCERSTIQQLSRTLEMSIPTVTKNINELIQKGLVEDSGEFHSTGGRKPMTVSPIVGAKIALGVDITRNHIGLVTVDLRSNVRQYLRLRKKYAHDPAYYADVARMLDEFIQSNQLPKDRILGVGVAVPGIVSVDGQTIISSGVLNLLEPVDNPFGASIPYETNIFNEASAAGFIEWYGYRDIQNMIYLSLSNSVGGAIIINNRNYPGETQMSAEFGHVIVHPGGRQCYCGKRGCYDPYGSALTLSNLSSGNLSAFFAELKKGDAAFREAFDRYIDDLALLVGNLRNSFDCMVVLGGYVGSYLEDYLEEIKKRAVAYTHPNHRDAEYLKVCRYKVEASAVGVAMRYVDAFINNV